MRIVVADASSLVEFLFQGKRAGSVDRMISSPEVEIWIPFLCDIEVAAAIRRAVARGYMSRKRATAALDDYLDVRLTRHGHGPLLARILELGANFSAYDATYVALAERLAGDLLTMDEPLARATRKHTAIHAVP